MKSSLNSNQIISVQNLNLVYEVNHYSNKSVRDLFIGLVGSPLKTLRAKERYYHVLKDINFDIHQGDRVGLIGVNGAGKTSLCRCIAGMVSPNTGNILIDGKVRAIFDTGVGVVPELTGRENAEVICALLYPEIGPGEREQLINESLEFSELGEFLDVPYLKYSKGMQARLSLSLVSARGCDLLVLDEVYDGADIFFQEKISKRVHKMMENSGAVLFVSHSIDQIEKACNKLIILDNSQIIYNGDIANGISLYRGLFKL
jgi:ABC-type polysaccharide/polyol phosphate transport system ATPase subunit